MDCLICARNNDGRQHAGSVGCNVYEDAHWYAYHAPVQEATLGQLFLVSRRHLLDFSEMTPDELGSYGSVLGKLCAALKRVVDAERVYILVTVEGVPHFHARLIPRPADAPTRGWAYVVSERSCSTAGAAAAVAQIRQIVASADSAPKN